MLAGLTTNVELLMLALDFLVEAEQLVSSTGAGVVSELPVELSLWMWVLLFLGVVPFLSHSVLHVQKYYLTTQ